MEIRLDPQTVKATHYAERTGEDEHFYSYRVDLGEVVAGILMERGT